MKMPTDPLSTTLMNRMPEPHKSRLDQGKGLPHIKTGVPKFTGFSMRKFEPGSLLAKLKGGM